MEVRPGYKQTEIGIVPDEWETYVLEEISERISVGLATSVTKHYRRSGVPIVRNLNIKDGYFDGSDILFVSREFASANSNKAARAFDVLTVHTGSNLGQTCVLPLEFDNCQTFTTLITTPKKRITDPYFLCLHMSSQFGRNEMARLQAGGGKGNLNTGELKKYRIALPRRVNEQRAIAEAMSDVDGLLGGLDRLISKKRDLKQAVMQQLLRGQTRLPGFLGEWKPKTFAELLKYERPDKFLVNSSEYLEKGDIPVLTANKSFILGYTNDEFGVYQNLPAIIFDDFTTDSKYVDFPFKVKSSAIKILKARSPEVNLRFIFARMRLVDFPLGEHKRYYISEYQHIELPTPEPAEQTAIAEVLTEMDAELAALEQRREKTRALKQAMMQELLTGRTRLVTPKEAHA